MDIEATSYYLDSQERIVAGVLERLVSTHGCPCVRPQFEYWISKEQGPGWHDSIQNELVEVTLKLSIFQCTKPSAPEYGLEALATCSVCGRQWKYYSEEWRMGALRKRLLPRNKADDVSSFPPMVDANCFATVGFEPKNYHAVTLEQWAEFMLGAPYEGAADAPKTLTEGPSRSSIVRGLRKLLRCLA